MPIYQPDTQGIAQGIDRITSILQQKAAQPMSTENMSPALLNAIQAGAMRTGGSVTEGAQNYLANQQKMDLSGQNALMQAYEAKLNMGDKMTKALDDKITLFTGGDAEGKAMFLQALHEDPEDIDPTNSFKVMTKLAGIKKRTGYESPELAREDRIKQLDVQAKELGIIKTKAEIGKLNRSASGVDDGDSPAPIKVANEYKKAREAGDTNRMNEILMFAKALPDKSMQITGQGTYQNAPGVVPATQQMETGKGLAKKIGEKSGEVIVEKRQKAQDAALTLTSNQEARKLLDSGVITGTGANYIKGFGKALNQIGFNVSKDEIANTEAFVAQRALEVGRLITMFGAGTGLSDADRDYANKAAAGDITMTEESIRKILDISDTAARNSISNYSAEIENIPQEAMPFNLGITDPEADDPITAELKKRGALK
jgi:hypothetical protein